MRNRSSLREFEVRLWCNISINLAHRGGLPRPAVCRAGGPTAYRRRPSGSTPAAPAARPRPPFGASAAPLSYYAWFNPYSGGRTHAAGRCKPNAWLLFDMQGNVSEWCHDWFGGPYPAAPATDPTGPRRVFRGGTWRTWDCPSAKRNGAPPDHTAAKVGFRLALARQ